METQQRIAAALEQLVGELQLVRKAIHAQHPEVLARREHRREEAAQRRRQDEEAAKVAAEDAARAARYESLLDLAVNQIGLHPRTAARLMTAGIGTVRKLHTKTAKELRELAGIWGHTARGIQDTVDRLLRRGQQR